MIPKIIHQTWKTDQVPNQWNAFVQSWKFHHPDWEYKLWTNNDGQEFVEQFYPEFLKTYLGYPYDIQRADAIRYLVIYHYGGLYADLDFECLQSFDGLRNSKQLIIGFEPQKHADQQSQQELLCNALLASQPQSVFLKAVIDYLVADSSCDLFKKYNVLHSTGPVMLQKVYEQLRGKGVDAHPAIRFCPFVNNSHELAVLAENSDNSAILRKELVDLGCYAVHHWANSWTKDAPEKLLNPRPNTIEGFDFYPLQDSVGMDAFYGGRNITVLAHHCKNDHRIVAFNTDGFAKHTICATSAFQKMQNANHNEGIYVKKVSNEPTALMDKELYMPFINLTEVGPKPFRLFIDEMNDSMISRLIRKHGVWEPVVTALVRKLVTRGDAVVDIGAHIGYFTVLYSQLVGERGKIYSFEPENNNYELLEVNILTNRLKNVTTENQALSNKPGVASLHLSDDNKGDHRLVTTPNREVQKSNLITLDQYLSNDQQKIDFIKSDTQGHELEVLQGMTRTIDKNKDRLCCLLEFSPSLLAAADPKGVARFIDFFDAYQSEIYCIKDMGNTQKLVLVDKEALQKISRTMLKHEDIDHSCNILVFFSAKARMKYFSKLGW